MHAIAGSDVLLLADGTRLRLRQIGAQDREGIATLFERMTPESRRGRFLAPKPALSAGELEYLTAIDHVRHDAIAAVDDRDGSIVGVGRYAHAGGEPGVAEVAVTVADAWQGRGIGTALARRTALRARANGFTLLRATTLCDNHAARALLRRFGFQASGCEDGVMAHEAGWALRAAA